MLTCRSVLCSRDSVGFLRSGPPSPLSAFPRLRTCLSSPLSCFLFFFLGGHFFFLLFALYCYQTQGPRKGEDDRHKLKVALEDLYNGKTCRLAVTRNKVSTSLRLNLKLNA